MTGDIVSLKDAWSSGTFCGAIYSTVTDLARLRG